MVVAAVQLGFGDAGGNADAQLLFNALFGGGVSDGEPIINKTAAK